MYTIKQIREIKRQIEFYDLSVPEGFWKISAKKLQKFCNGCGSESWSKGKREALTKALARYEAAFAVHDVDYEIGTNKKAADKRLKSNMVKILKRDYGFFWWLSRTGRAERFVVIPAVYAAVALCGGDAYAEAQKEAP